MAILTPLIWNNLILLFKLSYNIKLISFILINFNCETLNSDFFATGEEEEDDPDFDPSKVKGGDNPQECKQQ